MNELARTNDPGDLAQALAVSVALMRAGIELELSADQRLGINAHGFYSTVQLGGEWRTLPLPGLSARDLVGHARRHPQMLSEARAVIAEFGRTK